MEYIIANHLFIFGVSTAASGSYGVQSFIQFFMMNTVFILIERKLKK